MSSHERDIPGVVTMLPFSEGAGPVLAPLVALDLSLKELDDGLKLDSDLEVDDDVLETELCVGVLAC